LRGTRPGPLSSGELTTGRETRAALESGTVGVSGNVGFVPGVYADHAEFVALTEEASRAGATFAVCARVARANVTSSVMSGRYVAHEGGVGAAGLGSNGQHTVVVHHLDQRASLRDLVEPPVVLSRRSVTT
jgi:hypothetical protein